jgi:hypothetical protein
VYEKVRKRIAGYSHSYSHTLTGYCDIKISTIRQELGQTARLDMDPAAMVQHESADEN